jgi:IS4 transposase
MGHVYTRSLRHGTVQHLTLGDQSIRRREHDMLALKRLDRQVQRKVTYAEVHSGEVLEYINIFEYITNVTDLKIPPGLIALLYKMRWNVEKSFDEMKNKLRESKAWASSMTAKQMQAQLVCLTLNLVLLMEGE